MAKLSEKFSDTTNTSGNTVKKLSQREVDTLASLYDLEDISEEDIEQFAYLADKVRRVYLHFSGISKVTGAKEDFLLIKDLDSDAVYEYANLNIQALENLQINSNLKKSNRSTTTQEGDFSDLIFAKDDVKITPTIYEDCCCLLYKKRQQNFEKEVEDIERCLIGANREKKNFIEGYGFAPEATLNPVIVAKITEQNTPVDTKAGEVMLEEIASRVEVAQAKREKGSNVLIVPDIISPANNQHGTYYVSPVGFSRDTCEFFDDLLVNKGINCDELFKNWLRDVYMAYKQGENLGFIYTDIQLKNTVPLLDKQKNIRFLLIDFDCVQSQILDHSFECMPRFTKISPYESCVAQNLPILPLSKESVVDDKSQLEKRYIAISSMLLQFMELLYFKRVRKKMTYNKEAFEEGREIFQQYFSGKAKLPSVIRKDLLEELERYIPDRKDRDWIIQFVFSQAKSLQTPHCSVYQNEYTGMKQPVECDEHGGV